MKTGLIIKLLRTASRLSQEELAERLEVSRPYLSQVENGHRDPSLGFLREVSRELEIPLPLLLLQETDHDSVVMTELRKLLTDVLAAKVTLWSQPS